MNRSFVLLVTSLAFLPNVAIRARAGDPPPTVPAPAPAPADAAAAAIAPEKLTKGTLSDEAYAFKQEVYRRHVERGVKSGRPRIYDLPASDLAEVPGTKTVMRRDAAAALGKLLIAARADLATDLAATGTDAETVDRRTRAQQVQDIGLNNAYRSASTQFAIWNRNFNRYLDATRAGRLKCAGGEFGPAAADLLRDYIGVRVAAPGFSNHQGGIAVDFSLDLKPVAGTPDAKTALGASTADSDPWKESWFWRWLNRRAGEFGFIPYLPEPWHWEYQPDRVGKGRPE
jgi:hypothetical protein